MITTTVIWPVGNGVQNPCSEESAALNAYAAELAPDFDSELTSTLSTDGKIIVANRTWPSQEIAQQWVDYVLANYNVSSAVVDL